eukprot:2584512-Pyramimonas_sp.AAC.1
MPGKQKQRDQAGCSLAAISLLGGLGSGGCQYAPKEPRGGAVRLARLDLAEHLFERCVGRSRVLHEWHQVAVDAASTDRPFDEEAAQRDEQHLIGCQRPTVDPRLRLRKQ